MKCCTLPDACLDILPNMDTLEQWRRGINRNKEPAQFRLHVAGLAEPEVRSLEKGCLLSIPEPLLPIRLRHLERDRSCFRHPRAGPYTCQTGIVHENSSKVMHRGRQSVSATLTMVWPKWENGYGDVIAETMLPFGDMYRLDKLPNLLAVSGMKAPSLVVSTTAVTNPSLSLGTSRHGTYP